MIALVAESLVTRVHTTLSFWLDAQCGEVPDEPALCLVCGKLFCLNKKDGSAECTKHTQTCCGDVGAWLHLKVRPVCLSELELCFWATLVPFFFFLGATHLRHTLPLSKGDAVHCQYSVVWLAMS